MQKQDDDRFRIKPRAPRSGQGLGRRTFLTQVLIAASKAGGAAGKARGQSTGLLRARLDRGKVAARLSATRLDTRSRRVVTKTRLVILGSSRSTAVAAHLRYITRDSVTRDGQPGQAYDATSDAVDVKAFEERGRGDRHQFRFIVSPEDAEQLADLRRFTRSLMAQMETDLETRLEWVAVDHWDTDNPHTHVVLRGTDQSGRDLVIGRDYIKHGLRRRACELSTEWLGPRTELEIRKSIRRDVDQERWTGLDRVLVACVREGVVDVAALSDRADQESSRSTLIGRLQRLSAMGLAQQEAPMRWRLKPGFEKTLRTLGERRDIIRTMQRALAGERREIVIPGANAGPDPVVGRVAGKGLADELNDRGYLIVDGIDGRARYVTLPSGVDLAEMPIGAIVEVARPAERVADRNIAAMAKDGLYRTHEHKAQLRSTSKSSEEIDAIVAGHVRRLEALRRAGIVERIEDSLWRVPDNLVARGRIHDNQRLPEGSVHVLSQLPIDKQVRAIGATWLDAQLVERGQNIAPHGFGNNVRDALKARTKFLIEQGLATRTGQQVLLARDLLTLLRAREIDEVGKDIAAKTGLTYRPILDGRPACGTYRRSVMLVSGRFAMLDDGVAFSLVPWRPVIEKRLGQGMGATVRGQNVSWALGRQRGISIR